MRAGLIDKLLLTEQLNIKTSLSPDECVSCIQNLALSREDKLTAFHRYDLRRLTHVKPNGEFSYSFVVQNRRGQKYSEMITTQVSGKIIYDESAKSTLIVGKIHLGSLAVIGTEILGIYALGVTISFLEKGVGLAILYFVIIVAIARYWWSMILEDKKNLKMLFMALSD